MKNLKWMMHMFVGLLISTSLLSQEEIKTQEFLVERTIQASAEEVWKVVGEEFYQIEKSHPLLTSSSHIEGSVENGEGCERLCSMSDNGKKYTQERQVEYNPEEYSFKVVIMHIGGLPLEEEISYMIYDVDPIDDNSCILRMSMVYRTDPAFLGAIAKSKFRKNIENYAIGIEHHVLTGENVGPDNFKEIKKKYKV